MRLCGGFLFGSRVNLSTFKFESREVRAVTVDGAPWFVATDVATVLDYRNAPDMTRSLDADEAATHTVRSRSDNGVEQSREVTIINESGLYSAILKSRKPEAKAFKKWVTSEVLPSIRKTGSYTPAPTTNPVAQGLESLEVLARFLNVAPSGRITMARAYLESSAPTLLPALPSYAVDAPSDVPSDVPSDAPSDVLISGNGSSLPTASATELLKHHRVGMSTDKFNQKLAQAGLIELLTRPSTSQGTKSFWSITSRGLTYGKNITSQKNARVTQPHWYIERFRNLLADLEVL